MEEMQKHNRLKAVWILSRLKGIGPKKFKDILSAVKDPALFLDDSALEEICFRSALNTDFVREFQVVKTSGDFDREFELCAQKGIQLIDLTSSDFPKNLSTVYDPPLILYVKGKLIPEDQAALAIVGTRHPSLYGIKTARRLSSELAGHGVTIVSGLARGVDGEAHKGALEVKGRTIAVLGCGIDMAYPKEHRDLYETIAEHGAVVSEFSPGTEPLRFNFPLRNRIISGLSLGVLVVEASRKSGSLITADLATQEGREVYAIPGPIDSAASMGTNHLIQTGAKLVTSSEDILEDLSLELSGIVKEWKPLSGLSVEIKKDENLPELIPQDMPDPILKLLANKPFYFDELVQTLGEGPSGLYPRLMRLELEGRIRKSIGGLYTRS